MRQVFDFCVDESISNADWPDAAGAARLTALLDQALAGPDCLTNEQEVFLYPPHPPSLSRVCLCV